MVPSGFKGRLAGQQFARCGRTNLNTELPGAIVGYRTRDKFGAMMDGKTNSSGRHLEMPAIAEGDRHVFAHLSVKGSEQHVSGRQKLGNGLQLIEIEAGGDIRM
jgi:hypothetical protein